MSIPANFRAFRIHSDDAGYRSGIETISLDDLNPGEVAVKAAYSSVNYKDALAGTGKGKILRRFPLVGGIDVAGEVVARVSKSTAPIRSWRLISCGMAKTVSTGTPVRRATRCASA